MLAWINLLPIFILNFSNVHCNIILYNTEYSQLSEKFDCLYFLRNDGQNIPFCQRLDIVQKLDRNNKKCENEGEAHSFRSLLDNNTNPSDLLHWNSSIEMVDMYASVFYNHSFMQANLSNVLFICKCIKPGTFGKYCEYELTQPDLSFGETVILQYMLKQVDPWHTQRYGKILCYNTLNCSSGKLCLDWRDINDGKQQCSDGIDEENWDKLEFNECEDNEFRCGNGMCIPIEFWLDGDYDCMDWTDELVFDNYNGDECQFAPNPMHCDEHICVNDWFSCGDGQCIHWLFRIAFDSTFSRLTLGCYNKRHVNYMCEVIIPEPAWTLENGLCRIDQPYNDSRYPPWNRMTSSSLSSDEICDYLLRCILSGNLEIDCPCKSHNCTQLMEDVCLSNDSLVLFPPAGLINPNLAFYYDYRQLPTDRNVKITEFGGSLKCQGYHFQSHTNIREVYSIKRFRNPRIYHILCMVNNLNTGFQNFSSSLKFDQFCWNESLTFNGRLYKVNSEVCQNTGECISQYRIKDGQDDCIEDQDENTNFNVSYCTENVGKHRFQCFNDQHQCLLLYSMGTGRSQCSNNYDEQWYGNGLALSQITACSEKTNSDCARLKEYIMQSSHPNIFGNLSIVNYQEEMTMEHMNFQLYCDTFWHLPHHTDELISSCIHWVCLKDEYQCKTGQCIDFNWVCDGEWDCSDASDEEAMIIIKNWSNHNEQLFKSNPRHELCREKYSSPSFSSLCNTEYQFGCYKAGVSNPLDVITNPPCINYTQIGNNIEDCYQAYDEKNTFVVSLPFDTMLGFNLRCSDNDIIPYLAVVYGPMVKNCTEIIRSDDRDESGTCSNSKDIICLGDNSCRKNARCNGSTECPYGEDEYWCPFSSPSSLIRYRSEKETSKKIKSLYLPYYPSNISIELNAEQTLKTNLNKFVQKSDVFEKFYVCNRGVSIIYHNKTICLCPPAYYGRWCEFFSDRISIIAQVDIKTLPKIISNMAFKIRTNLLFNDQIIDYQEFVIIPAGGNLKHKFYLLYSRVDHMREHKQKRYFNRTDIINNHPYSVHFDVLTLENNSNIKELGSWHYPIYFDYLPSYRLSVILKFPIWFDNVTHDLCLNHKCNPNSDCTPILNENYSYYCSCKSGFYGLNCDIYENQCEDYCSFNALCRRHAHIQNKTNNVYCICPLGQFGPRCILKYDPCNSNPCLNSGSCRSKYLLVGDKHTPYLCICSNGFYGNQCEKGAMLVHINLNVTNITSVRATVVQFYDFGLGMSLQIRQQQVYNELPSIIRYDHLGTHAPGLGLMKIYAKSRIPSYYLIYSLPQRTVINLTSSPRHCPHVSSLLLSKDPLVPSVFQYHGICQNNSEHLCFYDEIYFCICRINNTGVQCFLHDTQLDQCDRCLSNGQCIRGDLNKSDNFLCLCPSCYQGNLCEFNLNPYGFTLDSLLVGYSKQVKIIYVILVVLFFMIGFFNNFCSFITFKRVAPRKFPVGNYLLIITCLNQIDLLCLLFKFIEITFQISSLISCKTISYIFSVLTRSIYWLISWVTVNRLCLIIYPASASLKNPRYSIAISIITFIILLLIHIHEIISYTTIKHIPTNSSLCVTNFNSHLVSTYNRISSLIHHLLPFLIQCTSITFLIILTARSRIKTAEKKVQLRQVLNKQFFIQKELYITPIFIVLSALPQTIFTFVLACTQLNNWQRHLLLGAYLISQLPQIFGFILYVLPSSVYKKEFLQTLFAKKYLKCISN